MIRTYSELITLPSFEERYKYLKLNGQVGADIFGRDRYLNQAFYQSPEWKKARRRVIVRDMGLDMALEGYPIGGPIYVHHMNPITPEDILERDPKLFEMENLICLSYNTHEAVTFGVDDLVTAGPVERKPFDTCPWR